MRIPVMIEPDFESTLWGKMTMNGIRTEAVRLKHKPLYLASREYSSLDWNGIFDESIRQVIVLAPSVRWAPDMLRYFNEKNISAILVSYEPHEAVSVRGKVRMDYIQAIQQLLHYLNACGKTRIALYGVNPHYFVDTLKEKGFADWYQFRPEEKSKDIYPASTSLYECYQSFFPHSGEYDAVICSNDIVAAHLLHNLKKDGIAVPEQLFLSSFCNTRLAEKISPSITCVTLDYEETGRQAVRLFSWLIHQNQNVTCSVRVRSKLIVRQSTAFQQPPQKGVIPPETPSPLTGEIYMYCDREAMLLQNIERVLSNCDETDEQLIQGLFENHSNAQLETDLFLSSYALRYRLKRLMTLADCGSRQELTVFIRQLRSMLS